MQTKRHEWQMKNKMDNRNKIIIKYFANTSFLGFCVVDFVRGESNL